LSRSLNFYIKQIKEISSNGDNLSKEFIFYLKEKLNLSDLSIFVDDYKLSKAEEKSINFFIEQKKNEVPLDYILQNSSFFNNNFYVDNRVLIPRPETELIVEHIHSLNLKSGMKVLDAGVGSGCIGCSLAKLNPQVDVFGLDLSLGALKVASMNKEKLELNNLHLLNSDWLKALKENTFDIIISNPPYISPLDPHINDLKHEPIEALVAENNGLADINLISNQAFMIIKEGGLVIFEHGYNQSDDVKRIMTKYGFKDIKLVKDYQSQPRITLGRK
jgi:release factor glutamine methyltransferase